MDAITTVGEAARVAAAAVVEALIAAMDTEVARAVELALVAVAREGLDTTAAVGQLGKGAPGKVGTARMEDNMDAGNTRRNPSTELVVSARWRGTARANNPEAAIVTDKRQVTPSSADMTSTAESYSTLIAPDDRAKPSSAAHPRAPPLGVAKQAVEAKNVTAVQREYGTISLKDVARISTLPFPTPLNKVDAAQQLTRSTKSSPSSVLVRWNELNSEDLRARTWVPG